MQLKCILLYDKNHILQSDSINTNIKINCMLMRSITLLLIFLLLTSCKRQNVDGNAYLIAIDHKVDSINSDYHQVNNLIAEEEKKHRVSGDKLYLLSANYLKLFRYRNNLSFTESLHNITRQIPMVFELERINAEEYPFITMASSFNLALKFEESSPELADEFLDKAISASLKMQERYLSAHLYHAKGRFLYNKGQYNKANEYFRKALQNYRQDDYLYISSMHNNFGMIYYQRKDFIAAVKEVRLGIEILNKERALTTDKVKFLNLMKFNLSKYHFAKGNYSETLPILNELFLYNQIYKNYDDNISISASLYDSYQKLSEPVKAKGIISYLISIEQNIKSTESKKQLLNIFIRYASDYNDYPLLEKTSEKLTALNLIYDKENKQRIKDISNSLNNQVIKSIEEGFELKIRSDHRKNLILTLIVVVIALMGLFYFKIKKDRLQEQKILSEKSNEILERDRKILQQNIDFQNSKIQHLHHNLSLKIETEKAFYENLKNAKKTQNIPAEEIIKDLFIQVNSLMQIDNRNVEMMAENDYQNKIFVENLSALHPNLTTKELKLCLYFRMDLSSKEISILVDSTDGTIRVYKTKIRAKLDLKKDEDISVYLKKI